MKYDELVFYLNCWPWFIPYSSLGIWLKKIFCKWKFKRYINMDTFSFDLVLNVDHCIIWSWTMPTMVTSVLEYLKIIPKCKKKIWLLCLSESNFVLFFCLEFNSATHFAADVNLLFFWIIKESNTRLCARFL